MDYQSVTLIVDGVPLKMLLDKDEKARLLQWAELKIQDWLSLKGKGATVHIAPGALKGMKFKHEASIPEVKSGVTVREICDAAPEIWKYPTLVRKVNRPNGLELEKSSDRRILLSEENVRALGLTHKHIDMLKKIEANRVK